MNILKNVLQGTDEWLKIRSSHFTASEAPSAFGVSLYLNRNELLQQKSTGKCKDISDFQQSIFDKGHEAEANARVIAEDIVGEDLCPITATLTIDDLKLLASYDGVTFGNNIIWEHKLWSQELAKQIEENNISEHYSIQLDQQLLISSAEKCLFMTSDGTINNCKWMWYETTEEKKAAVITTWKQFQKDLATFEPKEFADKPEAAAIMQLPALSVYTKGDIVVHGNLEAFKEASDKYIASINRDLKTDEDFVNAEAAIKRCKEVEQNIKTAKASIIGGIASVDEATRVLDYIDDSHAKIRLMLEKLVKSQKESIKTNIINDAYKLCVDHQSCIDSEFNNINFPSLASLSRQSFETACKGLRTLSSLHNAVDTEVAAIKIKLDDLARVVRKNLAHLPDDLCLFRDLQSIITKPEDDFKLLVESRLAEQKRKEEEAAQRAIAEAKAKEEAEAARVAAAQEQKKPDPEPFEVVPAVKRYAAAAPIVRPVEPIREKSFLVLMQRYEDLTDEEKDDASSNGCGKEYASYIRVLHNGETQLLKNDAVEPEDATFSRDFNWVLSAIREAYVLGVKDGKQSLNQDTAA